MALRAPRLSRATRDASLSPVRSVGGCESLALNGRSPMAARVEAQTSMNVSDYDYSSFFYSSSDDPFAILEPYSEWYGRAQPQGLYLFSQPMSTPPQAL